MLEGYKIGIDYAKDVDRVVWVSEPLQLTKANYSEIIEELEEKKC